MGECAIRGALGQVGLAGQKILDGGTGHVLLIERDQRPHRLYRIWSKSGPDTFAADPQAWDGTRGHGGGTNRLTRSR